MSSVLQIALVLLLVGGAVGVALWVLSTDRFRLRSGDDGE
jgi:hypothetical protein